MLYQTITIAFGLITCKVMIYKQIFFHVYA